MRITIPEFSNNDFIPGRFAFGVIAEKNHVALSENINPTIEWSDIPHNAKSLVLICVDTDVPSVGDNVNQEGKVISKDLPRVDFYHWVLINIDPTRIKKIPAGALSHGITPRGKKPGVCEFGVQGINDYTAWFTGDKEMGGDYGGYDGPCPPWNDELLHHYRFRLYALDVKNLHLSEKFTGPQVVKAMQGHVLAQAEWVGVYSLNPKIAKTKNLG